MAKFNEKQFNSWYSKVARDWDLDQNPDNPRHLYDYRRAYSEGFTPDEGGHWPSKFKHDFHPRRMIQYEDKLYDTKQDRFVEGSEYLDWLIKGEAFRRHIK